MAGKIIHKLQIKIKSTHHTSASGLGSNRKMRNMVGDVLVGTIFEDPPVHVHAGGWTWMPDDIIFLDDASAKIEYPEPETFNTNLLDIKE